MYRQAARAWAQTQTSGAWRPHRPSALQRVTYATAPPVQASNKAVLGKNLDFNVSIFFKDKCLRKGTSYSYNGRLIGSRILWSIKWCHFQLPWMTLTRISTARHYTIIIIINIEIVCEVHKKKEKKKRKTHKSIKSVYTQMLNQSKHIVMHQDSIVWFHSRPNRNWR